MACSKGVNGLEKSVPNIVAVNQDLSNWDETAEKVDKLGDIDGLVNCAGILIPQMAVDITKEILGHYELLLALSIRRKWCSWGNRKSNSGKSSC